MKFPLRTGSLTFLTTLVVVCVAIAATFITAPEEHMVRYFSSDTLYLPSIYRDLFQDGGHLLEWSLNPAPNFFPDMGLFFLLNWLLGGFLLAAYVYPMVQFVIMACLFRSILRETGRDDRDHGAAFGALLLSLLPMCTMIGGDFDLAANFLLNSYHTGAFVNALLATVFLLRLVKGASWWWSVPLMLVVMAAGVSDKLFWITFLLPATCTLLLLSIRSDARKRHLLLTALMLVATWVADRSLHMLAEATELNIEEPYAFLSFERIANSWGRFAITIGEFMKGPILSRIVVVSMFAGAGATIWLGMRALLGWFRSPAQEEVEPAQRASQAALLMSMIFFPAVLFVPVLNGSFDSVDSIRYNYAVFVLALLMAGPMLAWTLGRRSILVWACLAVTVLSTSLFWATTEARSHESVFHYRPERVKAMDILAQRHGLKNGVGDYWDAKTMTMFSSTGLKVLPIYDDLGLYLHVNRMGMFYRESANDDKPIVFSFVVIRKDEVEQSTLHLLGGGPTRLEEGPVKVLVTPSFSYDPATRKPVVAKN